MLYNKKQKRGNSTAETVARVVVDDAVVIGAPLVRIGPAGGHAPFLRLFPVRQLVIPRVLGFNFMDGAPDAEVEQRDRDLAVQCGAQLRAPTHDGKHSETVQRLVGEATYLQWGREHQMKIVNLKIN